MNITDFLNKLANEAQSIEFTETMAVIDQNYDFTETAFKNGDTYNEAGQNNGSCKLFAFAKLQNLSPQDTLHCFGKFYREDVLLNPMADDHQNIRNFMQHGWDGIEFKSEALEAK